MCHRYNGTVVLLLHRREQVVLLQPDVFRMANCQRQLGMQDIDPLNVYGNDVASPASEPVTVYIHRSYMILYTSTVPSACPTSSPPLV